jgi:poly(3-hydroxyalkanoate) synthetase
MTDIQEDRSTIKGLLATGQDVYLIDWGYPDQADRALTLDDYINGYLDRCVDFIREAHGVDRDQHPRHLPGRGLQPDATPPCTRTRCRTW